MKKRFLASLLALTVILSGCGVGGAHSEVPDNNVQAETKTEETTKTDTANESSENNAPAANADYKVINTSFLGDTEEKYYDETLVPSVKPYSVNADFSNVVYDEPFDYLFNPDDPYSGEYAKGLRNALIANNFAVREGGYDEFFEVYEDNRYFMFPSFVTVDSLMHTYHLYFAYLMKTCEKQFLSDELKTLSGKLLEKSSAQYEQLKGTEWEKAAARNLAFFYIGSLLQDSNVTAPTDDAEFTATCENEYDKIMKAAGISECALTGLNEDYSQYKPRGYYEGDEQLEKYFRTMMWYGRIPFALDNDILLKCAILQTAAIADDPEQWNNIYKVTSFFAGKSDDPGFYEMADIVSSAYGSIASPQDLTDEAKFEAVKAAVEKLNPPAVNSIPVMDGENPVIPSYRFMGQRFTVDAAIMQKLIYSAVKENSNGDTRMLPDTLDAAAALGSKKALEILTEMGTTDYKNYTDNLTVMSDHFNNDDPAIWNASLYAGWLNTLRPLFEEKTEGYPSYMLNEEWTKKNLETFAGSFAELKHDTILYSKAAMAEMGGGDLDTVDDRGYVDPQPVVYSRFIFLANKTSEGLESMGMLTDNDKENLAKLSDIARTLLTISEKELKEEPLTEDEYEYIRCYGGYIEHFWREVNKDSEEEIVESAQAPCPIIADIATDPNGSVLEVGTGRAETMFVVFPIDGELHVGSGSVYSFYQFESGSRLTDSEWRALLKGGYLDDDYNWIETEKAPDQPEWTQSYRVKY